MNLPKAWKQEAQRLLSVAICQLTQLLKESKDHMPTMIKGNNMRPNPEAPSFYFCTVMPINIDKASFSKMPYPMLIDNSHLNKSH